MTKLATLILTALIILLVFKTLHQVSVTSTRLITKDLSLHVFDIAARCTAVHCWATRPR